MLKKRSLAKLIKKSIPTVLIVLLAIYIMSVGPVIAFFETPAGVPPKYRAPLENFYAPLVWTGEKSDILKELFKKYIKMCSRYNKESG
ncbi:hypothetical protein [uncultured Gimesia sp.]|jgi:hypothetical protein|uniref:hypothetical protein n=1 Tax=uncultured Gimesia sp. TaxID=1678688 RepID=UPI00261D64A3|nr:hypothetical protein [uncultured Gimesia sp.]